MKTSRRSRVYGWFRRAAEAGDGRAVSRILRRYPELHDCEGGVGSLVAVLHREAPQLLEAAFRLGLHPDAGCGPSPIQTPLQFAASEGHADVVRLALRYGADPERRNDMGEVALGYACSWGQLECVRALVEGGAAVNAIEEDLQTGYRCTPLDCARQYPEIVAYLRSQGALTLDGLEGDGEDTDPPGATPL